MDTDLLIQQSAEYVKTRTPDKETTGHDWHHIHRVWKTAKHIAKAEGADTVVTEIAALFHDIADWKFSGVDEGNAKIARQALENFGAPENIITKVCEIVDKVSYRGAGVATTMESLEGKCVQDADRLDALGAIGIARCFAYGGLKNRPIYDPDNLPQQHKDFEAYKKSNGSSLNHFYEKLLLLKDRMQTDTGRKLAKKRHTFLQIFLDHFMIEWDCTETLELIIDKGGNDGNPDLQGLRSTV
ncbi:MAG TPA: HD domain-containing protein [Patescibacteria group bacterium]|nr:HD domain-containing protein [Patescibacteria group bacterium]